MANAELGLIYATPNDGDAYSGAYENANFTVEQVQSILEEQDYERVAERQDVYERAFTNNPEEFAQTFSIIDRMDNDADIHVGIRTDAAGNDHMVTTFRNAYGNGLNFACIDGKIIINDIENLDHQQYADLARFCWMNSLNIEFPDNIDEHFRTNLQNAMDVYEQTANMETREPTGNEQTETSEALNAERDEDEAIQAAAAQLPEEERGEFIFNERRRRAAERMHSSDNGKADEDKVKNRMKTFAKRIGKSEGETFFSHRSIISGAMVFRIYKDAKAAKEDGKMQKDGSFAQTYDVEFRFKYDKNNTLNATWSTANDAPIAREYADELVGTLKAAGNNYIEFEQPMQDKDKGTFRDVCASNGVIPLGFNLNKHHVAKMINTASGTLTAKGLLEYKARMAKQLRKQLENQNIAFDSEDNDLKETIEKFEAEVKYSTFNKACEEIQNHIHHIAKTKESDGSSDAVKVVGAGNAFCEFFDVFEANCDMSIRDFIQTDALNLPEEKRQFLEETGLSADSDIKLGKLTKEQLVVLYKCMIPEQEKRADAYFQNQFSNPDRDVPDSDFVKDTVFSTVDAMRDKAYALKENGGGNIYIQSLGTPKYHGPVVARNYGNHNNQHHYQQRRNNRNI